MPAKVLLRTDKEGSFSHIYNKGVGKESIFKATEDYEAFLGFLGEYLSQPGSGESKKKEFVIKGRTYKGKPHQPKNYLGKVELIAYSLAPDHFHLLLHQKTKGSIQGLIRSLCTRYSIYFNKKYNRTGTLFEGPYKSVNIDGLDKIARFSGYLHSAHNLYSSYGEYLGTKNTVWIKPEVVLSEFKGNSNYKAFVEKYKFEGKEKEELKDIVIETENIVLERRNPTSKIPEAKVVISTRTSYLAPWQRIPEIIGMGVFLLLLIGLGINNINSISASSADTLGTSTEAPLSTPPSVSTPTPTEAPVVVEDVNKLPQVVVKISDGAFKVNIRKAPSASSEKVGEAKDGDAFEMVSSDSAWYQVKLENSSTGYISKKYAILKE
jgi:putative transposase